MVRRRPAYLQHRRASQHRQASSIDTSTLDFTAGSPDANTYISETGDGEVILAPTISAEFSGAALPAGWSSVAWSSGGSAAVSSGSVTVDGPVNTDATFAAGRSLEFVATFGSASFEHAGFGNDLNAAPWAIFSTGNTTGTLFARTNTGGAAIDTAIPGNYVGSPHLFRIDWTASAVTYWIDGVQVVSHAVTGFTAPMRPIASDASPGGASLSINWMRMTPYAASGTYTSRIFGSGTINMWGNLVWLADTPAGTTLSMSVRTGSTPIPDQSWSAFTPVAASGDSLGATSRYLQYEAVLSSTDQGQTPVLQQVDIAYTPQPDTTAPVVASTSPVDGATGVPVSSTVAATFSNQSIRAR